MFGPPAGLPDCDWDATLPAVRVLVTHLIAQMEELTALVLQLEAYKGRGPRNSSKPSSSDGAGFEPPGNE
jgi:hypothetical protein